MVYFLIIYRVNADSEEEQTITRDGEDSKILNGLYDGRQYSLEDIESSSAYYTSPDGTKIAWSQQNASMVADYFIPSFGDHSQVHSAAYPAYR
jgi:Dipeptidyl peptidase IV (DPP IV) N-terminal region